MNRLASMVTGLVMATILQVAAQQTEEPRMDDRRPPRGEGRPGAMESLTAAQTEQVKALLKAPAVPIHTFFELKKAAE